MTDESLPPRRLFLQSAGLVAGGAILLRCAPGALLAQAMLTGVRDGVRKLKSAGKPLAEVQAAKPSAPFDAGWGKGKMAPDDFVALVYNTLR
jgi:hypothetical protein